MCIYVFEKKSMILQKVNLIYIKNKQILKIKIKIGIFKFFLIFVLIFLLGVAADELGSHLAEFF